MILETLIAQAKATTWQEWVSTVAQLASVRLAQRNNYLTFPVGLVGVGLAAYLCLLSGLYADAGLNSYYAIMSVYGWVVWARKDQSTGKELISIGRCTSRELWSGCALGIAGFALLYVILRFVVHGTMPLLDGFVAATAVLGMWWATRRRIENWIAYTISNLVAIPLFFYKDMVLFALMYMVFLGMAVSGYREWRKAL